MNPQDVDDKKAKELETSRWVDSYIVHNSERMRSKVVSYNKAQVIGNELRNGLRAPTQRFTG